MTYATSKIIGKIVSSTRPRPGQEYWSTIIIMPSNDNYSSPATIEVFSKSELGHKDQELELDIKIGGYRNNYSVTDRETGEVRLIRSARIMLYAA